MTTISRIVPPRPTASGLLAILAGSTGPLPPCTLVVLGANGDLMEKHDGRDALVRMAEDGELDPTQRPVIPVAGHPIPARQYLKSFHDAGPISEKGYAHYVRAAHLDAEAQILGINVTKAADVARIKSGIGNRSALFYASLPPELYGKLLDALRDSGLSTAPPDGFRRIVLEKPFGVDLASAQALNAQIQRDFKPGQVLLVDHFLAYTGMLNLLSLRLHPDVNEMLSHEFVSRVDVRVLETIKSNDRPYFRAAGELIDLVQNHDMELLSTVACRLPGNLDATALQKARTEVIERMCIAAGSVRRAQFDGFNDPSLGLSPSDAETFVALDFQIDTPLWQGVPFSLISAKGMAETRFGVDVRLRCIPPVLARHLGVPNDQEAIFSITVHPGQSFTLHLPGEQRGIEFPPDDRIPDRSPHARLIADAMKGDRALFVDPPAAIAAWRVTEQIRQAWGPLGHYPVGTPAERI